MRPAKKSESHDQGVTKLPMLFSISRALWKGKSGKAYPIVMVSFSPFCQLQYNSEYTLYLMRL